MFETYRKVLRLAGISTEPVLLFGSAVLVVLASALLSVVFYSLWPLLIGLLVADIIVVYPYSKGEVLLREIEMNLPDALKQMATTLQSGGTFEMAVREVVSSDYGALSKQFRYVLDDLQGGATVDSALYRLSLRVPSELLARISTIVSDAVKAGGGLARVLSDVADDAAETNRLFIERKTKTTMQAMFLVTAAVILAPFIVGAALGITSFFISLGKQFLASGMIASKDFKEMVGGIRLLNNLLTFYVLFQAALSAYMLAAIRGDTTAAASKYLPVFLIVAYLVLVGSAHVVESLLNV
jgi:pilus assembly protein TadC